jgi:hypothetical protein
MWKGASKVLHGSVLEGVEGLWYILLDWLQVRDQRTDWDLEVKEPVAGNYYPVQSF